MDYMRRLPEYSKTEQATNEILSLPMYPELSESDLMMVVNAIKEFDRKGV